MTPLSDPSRSRIRSGTQQGDIVRTPHRKSTKGTEIMNDAPMVTQQAQGRTLDDEELRRMHAYWRAANYVSVGQIYLYDNPLL
jgi:hypothetical protein